MPGEKKTPIDSMTCRACGTFICLICMFRGVVRCPACQQAEGQTPAAPA